MPGNSAVECGNFKNLSLDAAKCEAERYLAVVADWTDKDLEYK